MPIYEYRRLSDGKIIEVQQSIKDDALTKCPETGDPVEKSISRTSFQLKGSGWYTTDYKSSPEKEPKSAEPETKVAEKTETKNAPATESPVEKKEVAPAKIESTPTPVSKESKA